MNYLVAIFTSDEASYAVCYIQIVIVCLISLFLNKFVKHPGERYKIIKVYANSMF